MDFRLIMVDECGDEVEVDRFTLHLDLDEDEVAVWQMRKIRQASERYPEAQGFYFEDRRRWSQTINRMLMEEGGYYLDPDDEDDQLLMQDWEDEE